MKISEILSEAPVDKLAQTVGQTAFKAGQAVGSKMPAPSDVAAIKKGAKSGFAKWATGKSELKPSSGGSSDAGLVQAIINQDDTVDKTSIADLKRRLPTIKLHWSADPNAISAALDQAIEGGMLDTNHVKNLKIFLQSLKKV